LDRSEGARWRERHGSSAGDAGRGELERGGKVGVQGVGVARLEVRGLDRNSRAVDPEGLELEEVGVQKLGGGGLGKVNSGVAGDDPGLVVESNVKVEVGRCVLGASLDVVDDEAEILAVGLEPDIIVNAVCVGAGNLVGAAAVVALVRGGVVEGVNGPVGVNAVRPEEVDARGVWGDSGILLRVRLRAGDKRQKEDNDKGHGAKATHDNLREGLFGPRKGSAGATAGFYDTPG